MADRKQELYAILAKAREELSDIEAKERDALNVARVGQHFRYRNSYGSDNHWWLYLKVLRAEDGNLIGFKFQTTSYDEMQVEPSHCFSSGELSGGYEPIPEGEFTAAWAAFRARINRFDGTGV